METIGNGLSPFWADLIESLILIVVALLVRRFLPAALEKHEEGSRVRHWANGAIPPLMYLLIVVAVCTALVAVFSLISDDGAGRFGKVIEKLPAVTEKIIRIAIVVFVGLAIIGANRRCSFFLTKRVLASDVPHQALLRFSSALLSLVVGAFVVVMVITELGYNVTGIVTGLGLGGLTFALAAKDAASNFFGGAILVTERPFEIGDAIETNAVSGTVVDINMRTTTIRTPDGAKTIVPNATISSGAITNWTADMARRRIEMDLNFEYGAKIANLESFIAAARKEISGDAEIDSMDAAVRFFDLGVYGLRVKLFCYVTTPAYHDYLRIRERLLYAIVSLAEKHELVFVSHSRTPDTGES